MKRLVDVGFIIALMAFIIVGTPLATFHGDESMQIHMSRDYWTALIFNLRDRLPVEPPYPIDSDAQLRILNGSVNRYLIGLAWHAAGYTEADLPPPPGWDWGLVYADNVNTGHRPTDTQLWIARLPSALLFALSVPLMFALGALLGGWLHGRRTAWIAAALYALNPVLLLHGRRATQEGALLFFGLLCLWIAATITARPAPAPLRKEGKNDAERLPLSGTERGRAVEVWLWLALAGAGGLALASKHSAVVFVVGAWAWVFVGNVMERNLTPRPPLHFVERGRKIWRVIYVGSTLMVVAALTFALFVALSPAFWRDPAARLGDLLAERAHVLVIQVAISGGVPLSVPERIAFIVREPFRAPPMHFELASWRDVTPIHDEITRYMASPLSGVQTDNLIGVVLTLCAAVGVLTSIHYLRPRHWRFPRLARIFHGEAEEHRRRASAGLLVWSAVAAGSLLANPLAWQRYALPWLPAAVLLAAVGLNAVVTWLEKGNHVKS
ncbi:MAG: phospholipid carrier-dependent glycosyltransferase [Chloroflexota bacterium]|nr:phospholipid carrier-dependent glycosyltransferase [Chloroflexota bacterium]